MKARMLKLINDGVRVGLWTVLLTGVGSILMFHVWNQYQIMDIGYRIAEVTTEHRQLLERNKKLAIEAAVVGRTERLSSVARERYGLAPIGPEQVRLISALPDEHALLNVVEN